MRNGRFNNRKENCPEHISVTRRRKKTTKDMEGSRARRPKQEEITT